MAKYDVTLEDGRVIAVYAENEKDAKSQASHDENSRVKTLAEQKKRVDPAQSQPKSVTFVKP